MNPLEFVKPELMVLVVALYFIGIAIKKSEAIKDNYIPLILGIVGIVLAIVYTIATTDFVNHKDIFMGVFVAATQGVICAGCSVYVNQNIKQLINKKDEDK